MKVKYRPAINVVNGKTFHMILHQARFYYFFIINFFNGNQYLCLTTIL